MSEPHMTADEVTAIIAEAVSRYRTMNDIHADTPVRVAVPRWALPLVGPINGATTEAFEVDEPAMTVVSRDALTVYLHRGMTFIPDGDLDLGVAQPSPASEE